MINVQQWEFCRLDYGGSQEERGGYKYNLGIVYFYQGEKYRQLASTEKGGKVFTYQPFFAAMGYLGTFDWELISVQHSTELHGTEIKLNRAVAYFKRPIMPGRRIDQPPLVLP